MHMCSTAIRTEQHSSVFESGDYEDIASDDKEMMSMTMHEGG